MTTTFAAKQFTGHRKKRSGSGSQRMWFSMHPLANFLTALKHFGRDQGRVATVLQQGRVVSFRLGTVFGCAKVRNASSVEDAHQQFANTVARELLWSTSWLQAFGPKVSRGSVG